MTQQKSFCTGTLIAVSVDVILQNISILRDESCLTYTLFVVQSRFGYRKNMESAGRVGRSKSRWHSTAWFIILLVFGVVLVIGSFPSEVRSVSAAPLVSELTPYASTAMETYRSAGAHPCKRGAVAGSNGTCVASGFSAGLPATSIERAMPTVTISQLGPRPYTSLVHQWRGFPPDRPPRS